MGFRTAYCSVQLKAGIDFVLYSDKPAGRNQSYIRKMDELLVQLEDKLNKYPTLRNKLSDLPLMIEMLKAWKNKEYTALSPTVITHLVSAIQYLIKDHDVLWDNIPHVGLADDLAVMGLALKIFKPDLKAFSEWKNARNGAQA